MRRQSRQAGGFQPLPSYADAAEAARRQQRERRAAQRAMHCEVRHPAPEKVRSKGYQPAAPRRRSEFTTPSSLVPQGRSRSEASFVTPSSFRSALSARSHGRRASSSSRRGSSRQTSEGSSVRRRCRSAEPSMLGGSQSAIRFRSPRSEVTLTDYSFEDNESTTSTAYEEIGGTAAGGSLPSSPEAFRRAGLPSEYVNRLLTERKVIPSATGVMNTVFDHDMTLPMQEADAEVEAWNEFYRDCAGRSVGADQFTVRGRRHVRHTQKPVIDSICFNHELQEYPDTYPGSQVVPDFSGSFGDTSALLSVKGEPNWWHGAETGKKRAKNDPNAQSVIQSVVFSRADGLVPDSVDAGTDLGSDRAGKAVRLETPRGRRKLPNEVLQCTSNLLEHMCTEPGGSRGTSKAAAPAAADAKAAASREITAMYEQSAGMRTFVRESKGKRVNIQEPVVSSSGKRHVNGYVSKADEVIYPPSSTTDRWGLNGGPPNPHEEAKARFLHRGHNTAKAATWSPAGLQAFRSTQGGKKQYPAAQALNLRGDEAPRQKSSACDPIFKGAFGIDSFRLGDLQMRQEWPPRVD
eukprot:TRINITY_DN123262_c0_g1_i1.p1 TRINITY_DN123262_c0_g1~~TRINITY_DN123262_c0_g1_i1.p1  ORF type:complete len:576 (+),score=131.87 TRINITY_DN123262_c0_g1_i1:160-1887(+)